MTQVFGTKENTQIVSIEKKPQYQIIGIKETVQVAPAEVKLEIIPPNEPSFTVIVPAGGGGGGGGGGGAITDPELLAIAALTSAADTVPYFTGLGTADLAAITAAARTFLAAVDAAAQRTVIGANNANNLTAGFLDPARLSNALLSQIRHEMINIGATPGSSTALNSLVYPKEIHCEYYGIQTLYGDAMTGTPLGNGTLDVPGGGIAGASGLVQFNSGTSNNSGYKIATPFNIYPSISTQPTFLKFEINFRAFFNTTDANFRAYIGLFDDSAGTAQPEPRHGIYFRLAGTGSQNTITGVVRNNDIETSVLVRQTNKPPFLMDFKIVVSQPGGASTPVTVSFNYGTFSQSFTNPANYPSNTFLAASQKVLSLDNTTRQLLIMDNFRYRGNVL
jgi:hypothetical protein